MAKQSLAASLRCRNLVLPVWTQSICSREPNFLPFELEISNLNF
jgi:hypothetical protein